MTAEAVDKAPPAEETTDEKAPMVGAEAPGKAAALAQQQHLKNQKQHLEQRLRRRVVWGSMNMAIMCGRLLSRLGAHNAYHNLLRRTVRLGAGVRRQKLPGISHAKAVICGVKCRIYKPVGDGNEGPRPVFIYFHGGGWVICSARSYHPFTLGLCRDIGAIVVSVDYRLAPEHPYPAGLDDCIAVTKAILNADSDAEAVGPELKGAVDLTRVVVGGDSAGGNLAAAVALELTREGDHRLCAIILVSPALQAVTQLHFQSYIRQGKYSKAGMSWFVAQYAGIRAPRRKLLRTIKEGKHVSEETSRRLIDKYLTVAKPTSAPDSGCQTAASSLASPNSAKGAEQTEPKEDEVDDKGKDTAKDKDKGKEAKAAAVPVQEEHGDGQHETDQLIEKAVEIPEVVSELAITVRAWPLLAEDAELAQLPPTMVQVCSEDPLLDEGRLFSDRMRDAGARDVRLFHLPRAQHAEPVLGRFMHSKAAKRGYAEIVSFFKDVTGLDKEHTEKEEAMQTAPVDIQSIT